MAFDSHRNVTVLFGGNFGGSPNASDTWEFDGVRWHQRLVEGPSPRLDHAMVFDSWRNRVVMYGGKTPNLTSDETWEWDGNQWQLVAEEGPPRLRGHGMAFDSHRGVTVLLTDFQFDLDTTWEWDGEAWAQRTFSERQCPQYVNWARMCFDDHRSVVVLFDGDDTWEWDGSSWELRVSDGPMASRIWHMLVFDSVRGKTVLFGGRSSNRFNDTWEWDSNTWVQRTETGPPGRYLLAGAFDSAREKTVIFGGYTGFDLLGDTWELDGDGWEQVETEARPAAQSRAGYGYHKSMDTIFIVMRGKTWGFKDNHWALLSERSNTVSGALAYHDQLDKMFLFGGQSSSQWEDGTWKPVPTKNVPLDRSDHAMTYDATRNEIVLFGGLSGNTLRSDTWVFDGKDWEQRKVSGPYARAFHTMVYDPVHENVVLFGGGNTSSVFRGDTWIWDGELWTKVADIGPPRRKYHGMVYDEKRGNVVISGGQGYNSTLLSDVWEWDGATWTLITPGSETHSWHAMVYDPLKQRIFSFGGLIDGLLSPRTRMFIQTDAEQNPTADSVVDIVLCLAGPKLDAEPTCSCFDDDGNGTVDLRDFGRWSNAVSE